MNGFFIILTAILSSGVVATVISASFMEAKERWVFRRQKIEEIYLAAATWLRAMDINYIPYLGVCKGDISYGDVQKLTFDRKDVSSEIGDYQLRMIMNINMYEPNLSRYIDKIDTEQKKLNQIVLAIKDNYKTGKSSERFLNLLSNQLDSFGKAGDNLKSAIVTRGAYIATEPGQVSLAMNWVKVKLASTRQRVKWG